MNLLIRALTFEPTSFDPEHNTIRAVISTGADVTRAGFVERLSMKPGAWSMARKPVPVLKDHKRDLDSVVGMSEAFRFENGTVEALIRLSDRPELAGFRGDVQKGFINSLSIGYAVPKWREFTEGNMRIREAEVIEVHEISFTPLGADPNARTRSSEETMNEEVQTQIRSIGEAIGASTATIDGLLARNVTTEQARVEFIRAAAQNLPVIDGRGPAYVTRAEGETLISRMADGVLARIDRSHKPAPENREFANASFVDIARGLLQNRGLSTMGSGVELLQRAMHTTSDFSVLFGEIFNKSLLTLQAAPSPVISLFRKATATDFRTKHVLEISDGPALLKVNEAGEIKSGTIAGKEISSYRMDSYARIFSISFQALVNDDIGALSDLTEKMTRGARQWFAGFLIDTIISNPKLADGNAVFHVSHGNLAAVGAVPSEVSLAAAKLAVRLQKDGAGNPLNATPRFILIPAALEATVDKLLATLYPQIPADAIVSGQGLTKVVEARLDAKGQATAWYLFASPSDAPVFEYSELSGYEGPRVESRQGFETLGVDLRVVWHLGGGPIDSRGAFKNPGV